MSNGDIYYISAGYLPTFNRNDTFSLSDVNGNPITFSNNSLSGTHTFTIDNLIVDNNSQDKPLLFRNISSSNNSTKLVLKNRTYASSASKNPIISTKLRNIVSIKLNRVIIPKPRDEVFKPDPYYFVCIDEFGSNIITTKHFNEKIFSKVHFDKELIFGGIANSGVTANGGALGTGSTAVFNETYDDGRKYMYYKNDDGDETTFYSSPLASLENLTIKILDSRGRSLSLNFNDSDRGTYNWDDTNNDNTNDNALGIDAKFINNAFIKDNIVNLTENREGYISQILGVSYSNNNVPNNDLPVAGDFRVNYDNQNASNEHPEDQSEIINLTNQIEYIFEVITKEPDIENNYRADLI